MSNNRSEIALAPDSQQHVPVGKIGNFLDLVDFFFGAVFFVRHGWDCFTSKSCKKESKQAWLPFRWSSNLSVVQQEFPCWEWNAWIRAPAKVSGRKGVFAFMTIARDNGPPVWWWMICWFGSRQDSRIKVRPNKHQRFCPSTLYGESAWRAFPCSFVLSQRFLCGQWFTSRFNEHQFFKKN